MWLLLFLMLIPNIAFAQSYDDPTTDPTAGIIIIALISWRCAILAGGKERCGR